MKQFFILTLILLLALRSLSAQEASYNVSGYISDANSYERLIGANVLFNSSGTTSNDFGFFSFKSFNNKCVFTVQYLGYQSQEISIYSRRDTMLDVVLKPLASEISEVKVTASSKTSIHNNIGTIALNPLEIEQLPVILGEKDIIKTYQLKPGVLPTIEGGAGMIVRGSDPGQNLILLDDVPVYNVNHLFGLFSVFSTKSIKNATLYKGHYPARYGGRGSSVLDLRMKDGHTNKYRYNLSVGLISSELFIEGPLKKEKSSFIVSARRTYLDLFTYPYFKWILNEDYIWNYNFYDFNTKISHTFNSKNRIYISFYTGRDAFTNKLSEEVVEENGIEKITTNTLTRDGFNWGNLTTSIRFNRILAPSLFMNATAYYTQYDYKTFSLIDSKTSIDTSSVFESVHNDFKNGLKDIGLKLDFDYSQLPGNSIRFGGDLTKHYFLRGNTGTTTLEIDDLAEQSFDSIEIRENSYQLSLYLEDAIALSDWFKAEIGLRYNYYLSKQTSFQFLSPRINMQLIMGTRASLSLAYGQNMQFIHLVSRTTLGLPTDQWLPVNDILKPIDVRQLSSSLSLNISNGWKSNIELYYKQMNNVVEYKDNEVLFDELFDKITQGQGIAKGVELTIEKLNGSFTGWLSYSLSKSDRFFEEINGGLSFPYSYDRRHALNLVFLYKVKSNIELGANWVFYSGRPSTVYTGHYYDVLNTKDFMYPYFYNIDVATFSQRNNYRLPSYQRLDISLNFKKQKKNYLRTWSFGVYNAYNHHNAIYYDFYDGKIRSQAVLPIIPSLSYSLKLN